MGAMTWQQYQETQVMFLPTEDEAKRDDSPIQRPMCIPVIADLGSAG